MIPRRLLRTVRGLATRPPRASDEVERAELAFYVSTLRPGMTVFDVGANVGDLSVLFARLVGPGGAVHAFEPAAETFERLRTVAEASGRTNIALNRLAVADSEGERTLHFYTGDYASWSSLADRDAATYGIPRDRITEQRVGVTTLDAYCAAHDVPRIDLLKIDVEGAELQVLQGAHGLLRERRIGAAVFEFGQTTFDMGNTPAEIRRFLASVDYGLRNVVDADPLFPGGAHVETAQFAMHVATPW